jgi:hypothetical protein
MSASALAAKPSQHDRCEPLAIVRQKPTERML